MRRRIRSTGFALLAVFIAVAQIRADTETLDPNIVRLGDRSATVRAAAAEALGAQ